MLFTAPKKDGIRIEDDKAMRKGFLIPNSDKLILISAPFKEFWNFESTTLVLKLYKCHLKDNDLNMHSQLGAQLEEKETRSGLLYSSINVSFETPFILQGP